MLDEKKRLFGVINPVDLVAILLAVAAVLVLAQVLFGKAPTAPAAAAQDTIEVELVGTIEKLGDYQYEIGQELSRLGGVGVMGTLVEASMAPARREVFRDDGTVVWAISESQNELRMKVRGKGTMTAEGASIGFERIRQNQVFDAQLPHMQVTVRVWSIRQVD